MDQDYYDNQLKKDDFDTRLFVQSFCKNFDNAEDLKNIRLVLERIKKTRSEDLKKNVYTNYEQFIQTSKEITYLEAEMYKLGHLLTEQKALISSLTDDCMTTEGSSEASDVNINDDLSVARIVEIVQGAAVLQEVPGRRRIYNGTLTELGEEERQVHLFLLNDCLLCAAPVKRVWGSGNYRMLQLLELKNIAVMDAHEKNAESKQCFKILQYPASTYVYKAETEQKKIDWVTIIKKAQQDIKETVRQGDISIKDNLDDAEGSWAERNQRLAFNAESLIDLPEELDVCIAQRDFDSAVRKLVKAENDIARLEESNHAPEIKARIDQRMRQLTDMLTHDSTGSSLYAGAGVSKKPVKQLLKLKKVTQATNLFLRNKSLSLKSSIRQIKMEGTMTLYITKLSQTFFSNVASVGVEFKTVFEGSGSMPAYVAWVEREMQTFVAMFSRQVFPQGSVVGHGVAGECVAIALNNAQQLCNNGLDMKFLILRLLQPGISDTLKRNHIQIIEASKLHAKEESWTVTDYRKQQIELQDLENVLQTYELSLVNYIANNGVIALSNSVVSFVRSFNSYLQDAEKMYSVRLRTQLVESTRNCLSFQTMQIQIALSMPSNDGNAPLIQSCLSFLTEEFIPAVVKKLEQVTGQPVPQIKQLLEQTI